MASFVTAHIHCAIWRDRSATDDSHVEVFRYQASALVLPYTTYISHAIYLVQAAERTHPSPSFLLRFSLVLPFPSLLTFFARHEVHPLLCCPFPSGHRRAICATHKAGWGFQSSDLGRRRYACRRVILNRQRGDRDRDGHRATHPP